MIKSYHPNIISFYENYIFDPIAVYAAIDNYHLIIYNPSSTIEDIITALDNIDIILITFIRIEQHSGRPINGIKHYYYNHKRLLRYFINDTTYNFDVETIGPDTDEIISYYMNMLYSIATPISISENYYDIIDIKNDIINLLGR